MRLTTLSLMLSITAFAAACASGPMVGSKESDTPPRVLVTNDGTRTWDNPSAFGPIPSDKVALGKSICESVNTDIANYAAIGYHSKAINADGIPFQSGGFLCVRH